MITQTLRQLAAVLLALFPLAGLSQAQTFPTRPITMIVPLAAGTGMDTIVRLFAEELGPALGQPIIVENQPGAAMMLAASAVARANPDGHTLLVAAIAPMAINQTLYKKINYDPDKDFVPIALYAKSPFVLIVNPDTGITSAADLIARAKSRAANPISYSTPGAGFLQHLTMEFMKKKFGFEATHLPYRSSPQSISDVVAGHVNSSFAEMGASVSLIQDGKLRALAITSLERSKALPDVPTMAEATNSPGYEAVSWHALFAPAATPKPIVDKLHAEMKHITSSASFKEKVLRIGLLPVTTQSPDEIRAYIAGERQKWGVVVRDLGLEGSQ